MGYSLLTCKGDVRFSLITWQEDVGFFLNYVCKRCWILLDLGIREMLDSPEFRGLRNVDFLKLECLVDVGICQT